MSDPTTAVVEPAAPVVVDPPAEPAVEPATPADPAAPETHPWDDPATAQAEIERLRRENGAARTNAKQTAADEARQALAQQIGKTLGLVEDDSPVDPTELTTQLTQAQADARASKLELAVYRAAGTKYDATALLDSRSFLEQVSTIDPTDATAIQAALAAAVQSNPRLKATQAAAVGGADIAGGAGQVRTYTREQLRDPAFYQANKTDIQAALREGRIKE